MMTIKQVKRDGEESVFPASFVNFVPAKMNVKGSIDTLWFYNDEGHAAEIGEGTVYVMNEHGKTVARYTLETENPKPNPDDAVREKFEDAFRADRAKAGLILAETD